MFFTAIRKFRLLRFTLPCLLLSVLYIFFPGNYQRDLAHIPDKLHIPEYEKKLTAEKDANIHSDSEADMDDDHGLQREIQDSQVDQREIHAQVENEWKAVQVSNADSHIQSQCILGNPIFEEFHYNSLKGNSRFNFFVSLHDPAVDTVISKGIKEGLYGPKDRYPSVDEIHAICEHGEDAEGGYRANCGRGGVFVEVGSAIGMVSLYAAARGMKVYAFDPLKPNIDRIRESLCLNGERECLMRRAGQCTGEGLAQSEDWGPFAPSNFRVHESLVAAAPSEERRVESEPGNLAATLRGGGSYHTVVRAVTIDESVPDPVIELLLLTCQGFEFDALQGAMGHVRTRGVRNVVWRRHTGAARLDEAAARMVRTLAALGYRLFALDAARATGAAPPAPIPPDQVMAYVNAPRPEGAHPNLLASLPPPDAPPPA